MPNITDLVNQAMQEAGADDTPDVEETETEKTEVKVTEDLESFLKRKILESPTDTIAASEVYGPDAIIPGFEELSVGIAELYGMRYGALAVYLEWKDKAYQPHVVDTAIGLHIVRGFSRREWALLQKKILEKTKSLVEKHQEQGSDRNWIETDVQMQTEEMIVVAGSCDPKYDPDSVRGVPTGIVSMLANAVMAASGHEANPLPPMPLK